MSYRIGLIGIVKEELKSNPWETFAQLAKLGYEGIESPDLVGASAQETTENRKRLNDLGLEVVAIPCSHYKEETLPEVIENAHRLGASYVANYWAGPKNHEELVQLAEQMDRMATACKAAGLTYYYHNHEGEFEPKFGEKGNVRMFDFLYENTENLQFQLDIAWAQFGGADPISVIRRFGDRIPVIHVKDLSDSGMRGYFSTVGMGEVDCFAAIEAAAAKGTQWMVVEQDRPNNLTPMESATASILNIREAGLHPSNRRYLAQ